MKSLKKYMAHKMTGGKEEHMPDIHNEEADELGEAGEGDHHDAVALHAQLKEKKGDKYKVPKEHANLLGLDDDDDYC